ncbi:MAG: hypothetical protein ACI4MZ_01995 [Christensenellales bacterium]
MYINTFEKAFTHFVNDYVNINQNEINNLKKAIEYATDKAYLDMQLRTIKGHRQEIKDKSISVLREKLNELFCNKTDFDEWHKEACSEFLDAFNDEADKRGVVHQKYGKAQKIVNMSLKYLYCFFYCDNNSEFDDSKNRFNIDNDVAKSIFASCHMPLDSYTLNWYYKEVEKGTKNKLAWSSLEESDYNKIEKGIKTHLTDQNVLQSEFLIWQQEKTIAVVNDIKRVLGNSVFEEDELESFKNVCDEKKKNIISNAERIIQVLDKDK